MFRFWAKALRQNSPSRRRPVYRPQVDRFEEKILPSSTVMLPTYTILRTTEGPSQVAPASGPGGPAGLSPSQVRHAYGVDAITFPSNGSTVAGDGSGQTIAIVDAYDDPSIVNDLATFDQQFGLAAPPSFVKVGLNANGAASTTSFPTPDSGWAGEIELDVEWAHAIAPKASIVLVEANSDNNNDLLAGINYARNYAGVTAVSMSWGGNDFFGQTQYDSYFTTPAGHPGITFFASAGDSSAPSGWPATSSHVVAVGGTTLNVDASGNYLGETAWADSGGGLSSVVSQPSYQSGLVIHNGSQVISANGMRAVPDVAYLADPNTGVAVYGSYGFGGWAQVGGTSAGAPEWAALMAIVDQGRVAGGKTPLDGYTQTLPMLYQLPSSDFHDITSGYNGYSAGPGFDLVTGRGSPVANLLVPALAGIGGGGSTSQPPTVATAAHLVSSTATTVTLGALGADQAGASSLTYTWALSGAAPGAVAFSPNGTNAASTTTATLAAAGTYTFQVTITDPAGLTAVSQVSYTISPVLTSVSVSPASTTVALNGSQQFAATGRDQFGNALAAQPAFTWAIASGGVGTISTGGLYRAPASGTGTATVRASTGTLTGTAGVTVVTSLGPTITIPAQATAQTATSVTLGVAATDPTGTSGLTYTWTVTGPAAVGFIRNGTNSASSTTATFTAAGSYSFQVTVRDAGGLTATSTVAVSVNSVLTSVTVAPAVATLATGAQQQFTATARDQFGNALASQPAITWSTSAGTVSSTGLLTAPTAGGSVTVTASSGTMLGQAAVTITTGTASGTLFSDNFESGASQWTVDSGSYYLVTLSNGNHRLMVQNFGDVSRIVAGSSTWTNYSYQATLTLLDNYGGSLSLLARVQDDNHLYFFGYNASYGAWMIARKDGPAVTTLLAVGAPFAMRLNTDYVVQANLNGSSLSLMVNGVLQVSTTDSTYASGKIGFSGTLAVGTLDNVTVTALTSPSTSHSQAVAAVPPAQGAGTGLSSGTGLLSFVPFSFFGDSPANSFVVAGGAQANGAISYLTGGFGQGLEQSLFAVITDSFWASYGRF